MKRTAAGVVGVAFLIAGCSMRQGHGPALTEHRRALSSASEKSDLLGFSLADALPPQTYAGNLTWNAATSEIQFAPSASETRAHWSLDLPPPGSDLFRIEEVDVQCDTSRFVTNTAMCDDYLDATLILHLLTDDGALSESMPVEFKARSLQDTTWERPDLDASHFTGTFAISANAGDRDSLRLGGFGSVARSNADGELIANVVVQRAQNGTQGTSAGNVVTVARWQADEVTPHPTR